METSFQKLLSIKRKTVSVNRLAKYQITLNMLKRLSNIDDLDAILKDAKKFEDLALKVRDTDKYEAWTKHDIKILLKMLWKVANGCDLADNPKEIRWLSTTMKRRDRKMPKGLISDEEAEKMIAKAGIRDKAIVSLLYEGGLRNSELRALKRNDVEFISEGARIHIPEQTKTGSRSILVIDSEPFLAAWLAAHPLRKQDAPLFPNISRKDYGSSLSDTAVNSMLKDLASQAGMNRRIYPHLFRHSAATRLASKLTDAQMKAYFGWEQDSQMASVYIHISGRDVDNSILAMHNKPVEKEKAENKLEPKICSRCRKTNMHDAELCAYCGLSFNKDKAKSDMISMQEQMVKMQRQLEKLETDRARRTVKRG